MKLKNFIVLIISLVAANTVFAESSFVNPDDYTGESFFTPPALQQKKDEDKGSGRKATMPPLKRLRLTIENKIDQNDAKKNQLAPTAPDESIYNSQTDTSEYVSKEIEENFDENMMPDGFEADAQAVEEHKKSKHFWNKSKAVVQDPENTEDIVLDCDNVDYDTDNYCIYATGNVSVEFVKQETVVKADKITYDRMNNTIKAEGNVKILKNGQTINGDYIFVDMNEESALIENPVAKMSTIEVRASKGYVYGDKIIQENGSVVVEDSYPINFKSTSRGPQTSKMITPKEQNITTDMENGVVKVKAKEIKITQKGDLETIAIRHTSLKKGKYTIFKIPALKIYTNKNNDYVETNSWELGSYRDLGMYIGPGFVFELPKGSVLKAIPILNYNHGIGVGGIGRFNSGTNTTQAAYATAGSKIIVKGKQKLDDNLYLQYAMNDYTDEWFLGKRRPKYGADLVYEKGYSSRDFLLPGRQSYFAHRFDVGYFQDIDKDKHFKKLHGNNIGTIRTRYMAEASQNLYEYKNEEKQTAFSIGLRGQLAASLYGTGDTQVIGRIGPNMHTQWRRWMQDVGYFQSVYDDHTPMPVYDAYRYGRSSVYIREYFRLCRYLTVAWFGSMNFSGDAPNDQIFQENAFYLSIGPGDMKFNVGYDFIRENTFFTVEMMMNARGTRVDYDKLVIKQDKKAKPSNEPEERKPETDFQNSNRAPVLQRAEVEDIKPVEDVL